MKLTWVVLALAACGGKSGGGNPDGGRGDAGDCLSGVPCPTGTYCSVNDTCISDGTCAGDGDCDPGMKCNQTTMMCEPGGCGGEALNLTYVPPNLLLVLDRSCSMRNNISSGVSKWAAAVASLDQVLTSYPDSIQWGLSMFPDTTGNQCAQDAPAFAAGPNNATPIKNLLDAALVTTDPNYPDGPCVTNIDTGIQAAALDPALLDATRKSYLMLISDGAQAGCSLGGSDAGTEMSIADLYTNKGVPTFVVGFGSATDGAQLDRFATMGGTARTGTPKYYQADTPAQLDEAFQDITDLVVSCTYTVDPPPPDLAQTYVWFENTESVPRDTTHMAGWDYDPATMQLTFYGDHCDRLKSHAVDDVDVIFGCPTPQIQ